MELERIKKHHFKWHEGSGLVKKYPNRPLIVKKDTDMHKKPLLWLSRVGLPSNGDALYLVNDSSRTMDQVIINNGAMATFDEQAVSLETKNYTYKDVLAGEAVKIDEYDNFYDLDYMINVDLIMNANWLGTIRVLTEASKGGVQSMVLLWENMSVGNGVRFIKSQQTTR